MTTNPTDPLSSSASILLPTASPRAFAIYAFRHPAGTGPYPPTAIPSALAACGIAVLALDLDSSPRSVGPTSTEDHETAALLQAAEMLRAHHRPPGC